MKCDQCSNDAAVHLAEVVAGKPVTRHLCLSCGKDEVPHMAHWPSGWPVHQIPPRLRHCSRCKAVTAVVVCTEEKPGRFTGVPFCSACADANGLKVPPAPADHVPVITIGFQP